VISRRPAGRALVAGWFSFDEVVATIGDELGCRTIVRWLQEAGWEVDVAYAPYLRRGVDWRTVAPDTIDLLVFTTGPLSAEPLLARLLDRFATVPAWAVNVSVIDPATAARFDRIWPRDDGEFFRPDLAIAAPAGGSLPLLAVAYTGPQVEYPSGRQADTASGIRNWLELRQHAVVELDMDLFASHRWPRRPAQAATVIARSDAVVTMRLHGLVLALAAGVPALAVDGVPGGAKVARQACALGWPHVLDATEVTDERLDDALAAVLTPEARALAADCRDRAIADVRSLHREVAASVTARFLDTEAG
jgi:hypothetical protein